MDELRPEYVEAVNSARLNFWLYAAAAISLLFFIPAAATKKFGCLAFPASYFLTWLLLNVAIQHYWAAKKTNAITDAEWADVTADTARLFAGLTTIPYAFVYVSIVGALIYSVAGIARLFFKPKQDDRDRPLNKPKRAKPDLYDPFGKLAYQRRPWRKCRGKIDGLQLK